MAVISKGTTFATGDQVTASKLNELVDDATFATGAVDDLTIGLDSNTPKRLKVKDSGIGSTQIAGDAVVPTKVSFVDDALAATDGHVLVADGTEFNNVAVSGDVSIDNTGAVTIADDAVTIGKIADAAIVTESEGIGSNDNDTTIPTSAAVKDYVDSKTGSIATYSAPNFNDLRTSVDPINISEESDPDNIGSLSSGVITISAGLYYIDLALNAGNRYGSYRYAYYVNINNSVKNTRRNLINVTQQDYQAPYPAQNGFSTFYVPVTTTISIEVAEEVGERHWMNNFALTLVKIF
jgi:hypothetical protein